MWSLYLICLSVCVSVYISVCVCACLICAFRVPKCSLSNGKIKFFQNSISRTSAFLFLSYYPLMNTVLVCFLPFHSYYQPYEPFQYFYIILISYLISHHIKSKGCKNKIQSESNRKITREYCTVGKCVWIQPFVCLIFFLCL